MNTSLSIIYTNLITLNITQDAANSIELVVGDGSQSILAALSASNSANSAASASGSAATATTQAGIATEKAGEAQTSASASQSNANTVAALLASFRSTFLGPFASDSAASSFASTNGITLVDGVMYENTTGTPNKFRIYNGSIWQDYDSSAQSSQSAAGLSAANALISELNAATSAAAALASKNAAATSETNSANSATTSSNQAAIATTKAGNASTSATNAATSETNSAASATSASNFATSATNSASTATTQAGIATTQATNSANSATASAASATSASGSATTAATQAGIATTGASTATTQAGIATTQATTATTQATNSANSASAASTSATNAATSEANALSSKNAASTSATAAAASATNFDKRYLGPKASAPTLDNQGATLQIGAFYWDTVLVSMRSWNGTAWVDPLANMTTELTARILVDQQLLGGIEYVNDLIGQVVVELIGLNLGTNIQNIISQLGYVGDLSGVLAKAIGGGSIILEAGSAIDPSLSNAQSHGTGLFFPAVGQAAFGTAGVEAIRIDASQRMGLGTSTPTGKLDINDSKVRVRTAQTPSSATASGNQGEICWDSSYVYICVATNSWKRSAIAAW